MSLNELQNYTYYSKYARYVPEKKRRETWKESVKRVKDMMLEKYKDFPDVFDDIEYAYDYMLKKKVLGSQRILQFGGEPVLKKNARAYNCTASYADRLRFFPECMYLLLCGCGTGFSVQKHHADLLPNFTKERIKDKSLPKKIFDIEDSIEGWSDSLAVLLSSYFEDPIFPEYYNCEVEFNYNKIRPAGAYLSSCSGKAPGPEPLYRSLNKIYDLLEAVKLNRRLRPIDAYDIVMHSSDAVLSGGVRRSATLCLFSVDDEEMYNAKTGDWYYKNPQRGRSNNSAMLLRDETTFEEFENLIKSSRTWGEPGFIWSSHKDMIVNPCGEVGLFAKDGQDNSGWQMCNLSSINGKRAKTKEDFIELAGVASIIGTLQAGLTDFEYLGSVSEEITRREALLGVSMTGVMENTDILLNAENQIEAAKEVKKHNDRIAKKIKINPAARLTSLKPEGTVSCFLGTSSGIHPHHAYRYFRTVQANDSESIYQFFQKVNPTACEKSLWSSSNKDSVIRFCIEVEKGAKVKNDLPALGLLKAVKKTQQNWIKQGNIKERLRKQGIQHSVSNTINVKPEEWDEVTRFIYDNREDFTGVSLLSHSGDKDYIQAPFTAVFTPRQITDQYGDASLFASGVIEKSIEVFGHLWLACDAALGYKVVDGEQEKLCMAKMAKFATNYFDGDIKKMTYCLKDVFNWKLWCDLNREYKEVNYEELVEEEDFTKFEQEIACSGGQCELI